MYCHYEEDYLTIQPAEDDWSWLIEYHEDEEDRAIWLLLERYCPYKDEGDPVGWYDDLPEALTAAQALEVDDEW